MRQITNTYEQFRSILARVLRVSPEEITPHSKSSDFGPDSLDVIEIVMMVEETFDLELTDKDMSTQYLQDATVREIAEFIERRRRS